MDKYELEIENLKNNINYENCISFKDVDSNVERGEVKITKKLFEQADFLIFFKQTKEQQKESEKQIQELRSAIKNKTADFPAIAIIKHPTYNFIADGNHRVYALFKEDVANYEALYIKRKWTL